MSVLEKKRSLEKITIIVKMITLFDKILLSAINTFCLLV